MSENVGCRAIRYYSIFLSLSLSLCLSLSLFVSLVVSRSFSLTSLLVIVVSRYHRLKTGGLNPKPWFAPPPPRNFFFFFFFFLFFDFSSFLALFSPLSRIKGVVHILYRYTHLRLHGRKACIVFFFSPPIERTKRHFLLNLDSIVLL